MEEDFKSWLTDLRNDFHQYPELSLKEAKTTRKIGEVLQDLGIQVTTFHDLTGAVGLIRGSQKNRAKQKTIALRADIDALPIEETGTPPYKSKYKGVMHACGHDANTAIALGVARKIMESGLNTQINGNIKLIFQPAEEKLGGSLAMIDRGVLETPKVDRILAGHMDPNFPVGTVGVFHRTGHAAADFFELEITGKGCHGARPHMGINPITAGGMFTAGIDTIVQRYVSPAQTMVISIGSFHAGRAGNVIPEKAILQGTIRTHTEAVRERVHLALKDLAKGIASIYGATLDLKIKSGAPLGLNDETASDSLYTAACEVLDKGNVKRLPFIMGSDDFYYFTQNCPGAMIRFGCAAPGDPAPLPLHSPQFDIDPGVLEVGVDVLFKAVENFFKGS